MLAMALVLLAALQPPGALTAGFVSPRDRSLTLAAPQRAATVRERFPDCAVSCQSSSTAPSRSRLVSERFVAERFVAKRFVSERFVSEQLVTAQARPAAATPPKQPPTFEQLSRQANQAREQNRLDRAATLYKQALALKPSWKEGWWYLGTLLYDGNRYPEAAESFYRLAALDTNNGRAFAMLGLCEFEAKQYEPALGHLNRARMLGLTGAAPQMVQVAMFHTAILLTRFQEYEAAAQLLVELVKQGNQSPSVVEAAGLAGLRKPLLPAELPPDDRELVFLAGRAVCVAGERNAAEAPKAFENLLSAYPKAPNVHYLHGAWLLMNDPDAGLQELQTELETDANHLPSLVSIALEYVKRGAPEKGREYAERAVKTAPASFASHAALGRVLVDMGSLTDGIRELEEARKLAPLSPQVRIALATAYGRAGRAADAARERAEFLKLKSPSEKGQ
jgi:tetratricopeptide (TPR) repeat protein